MDVNGQPVQQQQQQHQPNLQNYPTHPNQPSHNNHLNHLNQHLINKNFPNQHPNPNFGHGPPHPSHSNPIDPNDLLMYSQNLPNNFRGHTSQSAPISPAHYHNNPVYEAAFSAAAAALAQQAMNYTSDSNTPSSNPSSSTHTPSITPPSAQPGTSPSASWRTPTRSRQGSSTHANLISSMTAIRESVEIGSLIPGSGHTGNNASYLRGPVVLSHGTRPAYDQNNNNGLGLTAFASPDANSRKGSNASLVSAQGSDHGSEHSEEGELLRVFPHLQIEVPANGHSNVNQVHSQSRSRSSSPALSQALQATTMVGRRSSGEEDSPSYARSNSSRSHSPLTAGTGHGPGAYNIWASQSPSHQSLSPHRQNPSINSPPRHQSNQPSPPKTQAGPPSPSRGRLPIFTHIGDDVSKEAPVSSESGSLAKLRKTRQRRSSSYNMGVIPPAVSALRESLVNSSNNMNHPNYPNNPNNVNNPSLNYNHNNNNPNYNNPSQQQL